RRRYSVRQIVPDCEKRSVEFDRLRTAPGAGGHVTLHGVALRNHFGDWRAADLNPASVPEFRPPLLMRLSCRIDARAIGRRNDLVQSIAPGGRRVGLLSERVKIEPKRFGSAG